MSKQKQALFYDPCRDGVTQSLLGGFRNCRYKCRHYLEGWSPKGVGQGLTFGTLSHFTLELVYLDIMKNAKLSDPESLIHDYSKEALRAWKRENPRADKETIEFAEMSTLQIEAILPVYFEYWAKDMSNIVWDSLEEQFTTNYTIKTGPYKGTVIPIKGKKDGQFRYKGSKQLWLFETKNKSRIEEETLSEVLSLNLQVRLYLWEIKQTTGKYPLGVLYNIIRRPQLRLKVGESFLQFAKRCQQDVKDRPEFYFTRMEVSFAPEDIDKFEVELEQMISEFYEWWKGWSTNYKHYHNDDYCEHKYGKCEYLKKCNSDSNEGLVQRSTVFKELEEK